MTKYVIAILVFIAALAGIMLWVGDDVTLSFASSATSGPLSFAPLEVSWQFVILAIVFGTLVLIGLWSLFLWLWRLPQRVKSGVGLRRRNRALDAMEEALLAGAEGDVSKARKKAEKARGLIGSTELGQIVSALSAEACGDSDEAVVHYEAMLGNEKTRATGLRGLAQHKLTTGDLPGAIEQSRQAYSDNPNAKWAFETLFKGEVANHDWLSAAETLETGQSRKHIDKNTTKRRLAVLNTAEADRLHDAGQNAKALELAVKAAALAPDFAPAVALAAKLYRQSDQKKSGIKLIEKSWSHAPHPALALAYFDMISDDGKRGREKRINALVKANPGHRETKILLAENFLRNDDAVQAWAALSPLVRGNGDDQAHPSARLCVLAAQAEARLNNPRDAQLWMQRAATAPREADWSDLDPEGDSFDYAPQDWRRLVFSFGDTGDLIHPRFDAREPLRLPGVPELIAENLKEDEASDDEIEVEASRLDEIDEDIAQKIEDVVEGDTEASQTRKGLAERLDSLLDKPKD